MSKYVSVRLGGEIVHKHVRDVAKDAVICSLVPGLSTAATPLRIFEASAGFAYLSRDLADRGHDVTVSNYHLLGLHGVREVECDLNRTLPFADSSFDFILCREVIEHIESVPHTLREFRRVLAPGGRLVLTFPNRLQIRSRFYHLFSGFYRGMASPINLDVAFGEAHINLIGYPEMDYFLRKVGFTVSNATSSYLSSSDRLFEPLRWLVRLTTRFALLSYKRHAEEHEKTSLEHRAYNSYIADRLTCSDLFFGKDVIVSALRVEDGTPSFIPPAR